MPSSHPARLLTPLVCSLNAPLFVAILGQRPFEGADELRHRAKGYVQVQCRLHLAHVPREDQLPANAVSGLCRALSCQS